MTGECRSTAPLLASPSHGVMLVGRVRDLAQAYRSTVSAARSAVGRPFNNIEMKSLMRQATSLAAIHSSLIKMLNRIDNKIVRSFTSDTGLILVHAHVCSRQ